MCVGEVGRWGRVAEGRGGGGVKTVRHSQVTQELRRHACGLLAVSELEAQSKEKTLLEG